jgi:cyanophycin synthetase
VARRLGVPVTLKPLDGNQGKGVTVDCRTPEEVEQAYAFAPQARPHHHRRALIQGATTACSWPAASVVAAASCRRPAHVTGDGRHSIRELVDIENRNPARGEGHSNILTQIALDAHAEDILRKQGYAPDAVPPAGSAVDTCAATPICPPAAPPKT